MMSLFNAYKDRLSVWRDGQSWRLSGWTIFQIKHSQSPVRFDLEETGAR
jgi:hypothetical protein